MLLGAASLGHWPGIHHAKHVLLQRRRPGEIPHTATSYVLRLEYVAPRIRFVGDQGSVSASSALEPGPLTPRVSKQLLGPNAS